MTTNYNTPTAIGELFTKSGQEKAAMPITKFIVMALLGGAYIAFGGLLTVIVAGGMPEIGATNPGLVKLMAGALFPVGLILVVVAGGDLFTSDCAGMTLCVVQRKNKWTALVRIWSFSYVFNFFGALFVAYVMTYQAGLIVAEPWTTYLHHLAETKLSHDFLTTFIKGIGANWLVCLAVWLGYAGKDVAGKALGLWIPVMLFVTLGYEHSIANMFFIPAAIFTGAPITWLDFVTVNLIPATLGNIVGGALFVGMAYWYVYLRHRD